jgi:hypothetical protein
MVIGLQTVARWFLENPLSGAGLVYGVAIVGVILYTFVMSPEL